LLFFLSKNSPNEVWCGFFRQAKMMTELKVENNKSRNANQFGLGGGRGMMEVSTRAVQKLREELIQKCLDAGIGFRIKVSTDESGKITSNMKFDRQRVGDMVIDLGGVKLFTDTGSITHVRDYHLDYLDNLDGGFFLIKSSVESKTAH
jgi:Fe-S cluster assembly iron-binding protein IscA